MQSIHSTPANLYDQTQYKPVGVYKEVLVSTDTIQVACILSGSTTKEQKVHRN